MGWLPVWSRGTACTVGRTVSVIWFACAFSAARGPGNAYIHTSLPLLLMIRVPVSSSSSVASTSPASVVFLSAVWSVFYLLYCCACCFSLCGHRCSRCLCCFLLVLCVVLLCAVCRVYNLVIRTSMRSTLSPPSGLKASSDGSCREQGAVTSLAYGANAVWAPPSARTSNPYIHLLHMDGGEYATGPLSWLSPRSYSFM